MELFKVISETAGTIYRIETKVGDTVNEGDLILILESMKMEIEILAEKKGIIKSFLVNEGDLIQEGHHLVNIETS